MNKKQLVTGISLIILFQVLVLVFEYVNAVYPLWTGQEVKLKTVPVDPRSLFRGNYARLNYDIGEVSGIGFNKQKTPRHGEIVYVVLKMGDDGIFAYENASFEEPPNGLFIRGRVQNLYFNYSDSRQASYRVHYGIEAFFAPKSKALALETDLRTGGLATVMVASNGKATLKDVKGLN